MKFKIFTFKAMNTNVTIQFVKDNFSNSIIETLNTNVESIKKFFQKIEDKFSPFLKDSFVSNHREIGDDFANFMLDIEYQNVFIESLLAKKETDGIFNNYFDGKYNPTGFVKGWATERAFFLFLQPLLNINFVEGVAINVGGDMQLGVIENSSFSWNIGIENPKNTTELIASYEIKNGAVATSGINKRGRHIISNEKIEDKQITIVGHYLSVVDVWTTVGVACTKEKFKNFIEKEKLTGIICQDNKIFPFELGEFINVKKS